MTSEEDQTARERLRAKVFCAKSEDQLRIEILDGRHAAIQMLLGHRRAAGLAPRARRPSQANVNRIRAETGDPEIGRLFTTAIALLRNYHDTRSTCGVTDRLVEVESLMNRLISVLAIARRQGV